MRAISVCLLAVLACDPNAKATDPGAGAAAHKPSKHWESCSSSSDCEGELRCFDATCRQPVASAKGDYFVSVGELLLAAGRADAAIESFRAAEAEYKAESLDPPVTLLCRLGWALTEMRQDQVIAEESASRLHRCLLGAPVGSALRARALGGLAVLDEVGLDPVHLASAEVVDRYLTKAPRKPPTSKLSMKVSSDGRARARSFSRWLEAARGDEFKAALTPCWEVYWKASRKTKMVVKLPFRHSYRLDEYEDFDRATLIIDNLAPSADAAQSAAAECAKGAIAPIADAFSKKSGSESRWTSSLTFELDS